MLGFIVVKSPFVECLIRVDPSASHHLASFPFTDVFHPCDKEDVRVMLLLLAL